MSSSTILSAFNDHFIEFVSDIQQAFPDDVDVLSAKNSFIAIRKMNPKLLIKGWDSFVVGKYKNFIEKGDIRFFMEKDYSDDLENNANSKKIMDAINRLRAPVKMMSEEEQKKVVVYIQNLTKLSEMHKLM